MDEADDSEGPPGRGSAASIPAASTSGAPGAGRGGWIRGLLRDVLVVAVIFLAVRAYQQRGLPAGPAPELSGVGVHGQALSLADYRGKPVLLHFWATWCGVCKTEAPNISAVAEDLPVLTVASHSGSDDEVRAYMREQGLSWPTLSDPRSEVARRFGVTAFPTTFVLDADGRIRHAEVGYTTTLGLRARMWLASL